MRIVGRIQFWRGCKINLKREKKLRDFSQKTKQQQKNLSKTPGKALGNLWKTAGKP